MSEDLEGKGEVMNELINGEGVCRTAPAAPGLLKIYLEWVVLMELYPQCANFTISDKLDCLALLIADPSRCNSTNRQN